MLDKVVHGVQILAVVVVAAFVLLLFVNEPAQPAPVPKARGSMPSFADSLTPEQIAAVVDYTRNDLG